MFGGLFILGLGFYIVCLKGDIKRLGTSLVFQRGALISVALFFIAATSLLNREEDRFRLPCEPVLIMVGLWGLSEGVKRLGSNCNK